MLKLNVCGLMGVSLNWGPYLSGNPTIWEAILGASYFRKPLMEKLKKP